MATYSGNVTTKVYGAASGGSSVPSNGYAVCSYLLSGGTLGLNVSSHTSFEIYYGPSQTISSTITISIGGNTLIYSLNSGSVFVNTP